ncbi:aminotransferase class V-fold PLP-dependent enzyme [Cohnella silvisoli]|uniref:Aminotransferase class V-fold PLP-dependent enzyme n=1 Tax=Cohnella silvisoli TaxID=2873699 RepID=A0ABV1L2F8_9BACL|nr:aminotransferase class V-fold PLP-dependent enzyme [Cohnella silvisoli]MCD9021629.1 aminotransferase class V-fold PLP-dependent enzyme [Cohnella silvisoli]
MNSLMDKDSFIGLDNCTWLFNGAETPPHRGVMNALNEYVEARSKGPRGRDLHTAVEYSCKSRLAQLMHGKPEHIALMSNCSEALSMIAQAIDFKAGDNVVIHTLEFPSGVYPWLLLKEKGVEVRVVEHRNWQVGVEDILNVVDNQTKLVMTSHVSFVSGARFDYRKLYRELKTTDTLLLVDVTQSLGSIPVHMYEADFIVSSSYKWLLSIHGLGILGINPDRIGNFAPRSAGWRSVQNIFDPERFQTFQFLDDACKFQRGYPSYPTIYALNFSANLLLEIGINAIEKHILGVGRYLLDELQNLGCRIITPEEPSERAGNISFLCGNEHEIVKQLLNDNVYVWGGDGRIRASIHLFNDTADIDRFISILSQIGPVE